MADIQTDWYIVISNDDSLEQGDIIENCKIIMPQKNDYQALLRKTDTTTKMNYIECNCIILSQSCDLTNEKIDFVILCPIFTLTKLMEQESYYKGSAAREQLRQGNQPAYHLLNKVDINGTGEDFYCVSFHHIFSVPKEYLKAIVTGRTRLRLVSPYKENLAQSFARYFMRVGLPSNISAEEIKSYGKE
jgi:hypothetical protein